MNRILFLCSGNYYRSRFCELYFNALAERSRLAWRADSSALLRDLSDTGNVGPIAVEVIDKLKELGIEAPKRQRMPKIATANQIFTANRVYAASRVEHSPMIEEHFLEQADLIEFFEVEDVPVMQPDEAFELLRKDVDRVFEELSHVCVKA